MKRFSLPSTCHLTLLQPLLSLSLSLSLKPLDYNVSLCSLDYKPPETCGSAQITCAPFVAKPALLYHIKTRVGLGGARIKFKGTSPKSTYPQHVIFLKRVGQKRKCKWDGCLAGRRGKGGVDFR